MADLSAGSSIRRWRLVLGRFAASQLNAPMIANDGRVDRALEFLYGREYHARGTREEHAGSLDPSQLSVPSWLGEIRDLFPADIVEVVERHALDRYGLTELISDPETLGRLEPNPDLLRLLLQLKGRLTGPVLDVARRIVRTVVEELKARLEADVRAAFAGRVSRRRHTQFASSRTFDAKGTLARNLKHYDADRKAVVVERPLFFERNSRRLPWDVILCVDQSGSMVDSVIHSAVMAAILAGLPVVRVKLVVFDTAVVDFSGRADDPVEVLMSVQLGGGTDIGRALSYCEQLIENPHRTVLTLVSDFGEGASPARLLAVAKRIAESRVRLLGLASLDERAVPTYDRRMAERLAACGMEIAALTPRTFADWLVRVIS
jgi:Mg-chelatase subunit ChlD